MKLSRKTKIKIRRGISFARTGLLYLAIIAAGLGSVSVDGPSVLFPIICFAAGFVCFGISVLLDELLFQTAWSGDKKSPFHY